MADHSRPPPPPQPPVTGYPAQAAQSSTAYAYPYNPNPYNNNNAAPPFYPNQRVTLLRRFISIIIVVFVVFATISFIIWLVLRPRIPEFRVDSLTVSNFTVSSSQVTGDWDVRFSVRNPNKKLSINFDRIESYIYYGSAFLSSTTVAPFSQGTRNQTVVPASFASRGNYVEGWVMNGVNDDVKRVGNVGFDVRVLARARFTNGVWRMRRRLLRVLCPKVKVKLSSPSSNGGGSSGTLLSGDWECRVNGTSHPLQILYFPA